MLILFQENIKKKDINKNGKLENHNLKKLYRKIKLVEQNLLNQSIILKRDRKSRKQLIGLIKNLSIINKRIKQVKSKKRYKEDNNLVKVNKIRNKLNKILFKTFQSKNPKKKITKIVALLTQIIIRIKDHLFKTTVKIN